MKIKSIILFGTLFLVSVAPAFGQDEIVAIKAAIEKETSSFQNVDRKSWEDMWLKKTYAYWSYSDSTGTTYVKGWNAINKSFDNYFKTQVASRQIDVAGKGLKIDRTWGEIRIYKNGAFVQYTQRVKDNLIERDETSQLRILEKVEGKWKIVYVGIIANYPTE